MSSTMQNPDTTASLPGEYQKGTVVKGTRIAETTAALPDVRTTVTRRMAGTIELRYSPYEPAPETTTTAAP
jgi:hypothetical protein